jgi:hypothetical protein
VLSWVALPCAEERAITEAGFRFLLLDTYSQLWAILREYIAGAEQRSGARCRAYLLVHPYGRVCT